MVKLKKKNVRSPIKSLAAILLSAALMLGTATTAFACEIPNDAYKNMISNSENWVTPYKHVEVSIFDLGDGFSSIETTIKEYEIGLQRAAGSITQTKTVEIKNGKEVAATITVSGTFSYDGDSAKVTRSNHTRDVKSGYTETAWSTSESNSGFLSDAVVQASLTVKHENSGKKFSETVKITCDKNGD